jgi:alcohol dehydrogenase (cytochrome c)
MNMGTGFQAPPITYTVGGKQYIAIAGGGVGLAVFEHPELEKMQAANMIWVFALD